MGRECAGRYRARGRYSASTVVSSTGSGYWGYELTSRISQPTTRGKNVRPRG